MTDIAIVTPTVPLSSLKLDEQNVRKYGNNDADEQFLANIRAKGILEPLIVRPNGDGFKITNGGRRFAALTKLLKAKEISPDYLVPVTVCVADDKAALDISLSANLHAEMHPVDEFEAFKALQDAGMSIDDMSKTYGIARKRVEQALALGALAPEILKAWREGKINEKAASAFTIEPDQKRQVAVFTKLQKESRFGGFPDWQVRDKLVGSVGENRRLMKFVGRDAYTKAGGKFNADLFSTREDDAEVIADPGILKKIADIKIEEQIEKVKAEGWGWVEFGEINARYTMDCPFRDKKKVSDEDKKKAGALLYFDHNGKFVVERGFVKGKARTAAAKSVEKAQATRKKQSANPNAVSNALGRRLTEQRDRSLKIALLADKPASPLAALLAKIASDQINPGISNNLPHTLSKLVGDVMDAITPAVMLQTLRDQFRAEDYFGGINRAQLDKAIKEMGGEPCKGKKAERVKQATKAATATGWLPPQLRTKHYGGTKAAKKKAKA